MGPIASAHVKEGIATAVEAIVEKHADRTGLVLDCLNDIQESYRYIPKEALETLSEQTGAPMGLLEKMVNFYDVLSLDPVGRYVIQVCNGTACHTMGSARLLSKFEEILGVCDGETTPDGRITLKTVNCVGACGIAPVVIADGDVYGRVGVKRVPDIAESVLNIDDEVRDAEKAEWDVPTNAAKADRTACRIAVDTAPASSTPMARLAEIRKRAQADLDAPVARVTVGLGTCGQAAGASEVFAILQDELGHREGVRLEPVGCRGICSHEPIVEVRGPKGTPHMFGLVDGECARAVAALVRGEATDEQVLLVDAHRIPQDVLSGEERRVLANCGVVNPHSLEDYLARGGYCALAKALEESDPDSVIGQVEAAGLLGRGGAGFPTGRKWRACADAPAGDGEPDRYFIVNADEGDPGAYMDRGLLEGDPHRVLEGLVIGAFAVGAQRGYYFIRAEYPLAVKTTQEAIDAAYSAGLLGEDILGSGFSFDVSIVRGAGAFINGESTAMANVLENRFCFPRRKPPHLTEKGLWGKPTCLNNVETLANVPDIVRRGAEWFRSVGTEQSPGTKVFSVTGSVDRSGLVEVPLGTTLGDLLQDIAHARRPKAVQIGGPSGQFIPAAMTSLEMSFEGMSDIGGMIGSGGFVVLSEDQCVVDTALYLTRFCASQSCRKERECPNGLEEAGDLLEKIAWGQGTEADIDRIVELANRNAEVTHCGLGKKGLSPALSSIRYFRDEYEAHLEKRCPGLVCRDLISYVIDETKCQGERCCLTTCPGNAVKGRFGRPGHILARLCQKCGMCTISCPYDAVHKVTPAAE